MYWIARSRNPKAGVFGGLIVAFSVLTFVSDREVGLGLSVQCGLAFLLLHSLRWVDEGHPGAGAARNLACLFWFGHALLMVHWHWPRANEIVLATGGVMLGAAILARLLKGGWRPVGLPVAAILVLLTPPGDFAAGKLQTTPAGLLAVAGSFLLFALGTAVALTKPRWNNHAASPATAETEPAP